MGVEEFHVGGCSVDNIESTNKARRTRRIK